MHVESHTADHHERTHGHPRSTHWPAVRKAHLERQGECQACAATDKLNVHHIHPFHLRPDLELESKNLITLCEGEVVNCHLLYGHLRDWHSYNPHVERDAAEWRKKIEHRKAA